MKKAIIVGLIIVSLFVGFGNGYDVEESLKDYRPLDMEEEIVSLHNELSDRRMFLKTDWEHYVSKWRAFCKEKGSEYYLTYQGETVWCGTEKEYFRKKAVSIWNIAIKYSGYCSEYMWSIEEKYCYIKANYFLHN